MFSLTQIKELLEEMYPGSMTPPPRNVFLARNNVTKWI